MSSTLNPRKCNFLVNLYLIGIVRYGMGNCFLFFFVAGLTRLNSVYSDNPRFSTFSGQQNVGFQLSHVGLVNNLTLIAMHSLSLMNVLTFIFSDSFPQAFLGNVSRYAFFPDKLISFLTVCGRFTCR